MFAVLALKGELRLPDEQPIPRFGLAPGPGFTHNTFAVHW